MTKMADKRLAIEVACLRQNLWREVGEEIGNPTIRDDIPEKATDSIRWIDTDVMVADPLTKVMEPTKLLATMDSNSWDVSQPIEAVAKKRAKQASRRKNFLTAERVDNNATQYQLTHPDKGEPLWSTICRRVTKCARTGEILDDEYHIHGKASEHVFRSLPDGPRNIRSVFYYTPEAFALEGSQDWKLGKMLGAGRPVSSAAMATLMGRPEPKTGEDQISLRQSCREFLSNLATGKMATLEASHRDIDQVKSTDMYPVGLVR
jgi:hypothetical protein